MELIIGRSVLALWQGDITRFAADAIVNAANSALAGGGGVDGAIHRAAGPSLMRELDKIRAASGGCPTGSAVLTSAGNLQARFVLHAVGPRYHGGGSGEAGLLASCYRTCLRLAEENGARTIAFPSISTGIYGYPMEEAAAIALGAVAAHLRQPHSHLERATFVLFDGASFEIHRQALAMLAPPPPQRKAPR